MRFDKNYKYYDENAHVQKIVAENLLSFFEKDKFYESILEIGCGTGILTKKITENFKFKNLYVNDFFDTQEYIKNISYTRFIKGDMDSIPFDGCTLILSSSVFQWSKDLENLIKKLSATSQEIGFSIYLKDNLKEIENHFSLALDYKTEDDILEILKKYYSNIKFHSEELALNFKSPLDALKHLKLTGVTGLSNGSSFTKIKSYEDTVLTYKVGYFICKKENTLI